MGGKKGGHDQKVASQAAKDAKSAAERENDAQADWSKGANNKGASKAEAAAAKADEAARKKKEKADLLAEEEANLGSGGKVVKKVPTLSKNKGGKKKKNNDLSFLEDALVSGAEKKVKAKKKADLVKSEKIMALQQQTKKKDEQPMDPLLANTEGMIGTSNDDLVVGRAANKALDEENAASGIDGALDSLHVSVGSGGTGIHMSTKGLFKAYEARMMSEIKEDYPGLKLSQIKEKIFQKWKKSPENPANQQQ